MTSISLEIILKRDVLTNEGNSEKSKHENEWEINMFSRRSDQRCETKEARSRGAWRCPGRTSRAEAEGRGRSARHGGGSWRSGPIPRRANVACKTAVAECSREVRSLFLRAAVANWQPIEAPLITHETKFLHSTASLSATFVTSTWFRSFVRSSATFFFLLSLAASYVQYVILTLVMKSIDFGSVWVFTTSIREENNNFTWCSYWSVHSCSIELDSTILVFSTNDKSTINERASFLIST
jgi:hypothetical protein